MRDVARRIIRRVGVETGGSNIQFAINPADGRMVVIEMNPRVSRSSALASKATGFPIAKIAAKLALGYHLDEIPNDITRLTPASFEPTIDYVVVKVPRWAFEKFPQADRTLTTQMKSVGEAMAIGRTFKEAFMKAFRSLELGSSGLLFGQHGDAPGRLTPEEEEARCSASWASRTTGGCGRCSARSTAAGPSRSCHELTKIDRWFLTPVPADRRAAALGGARSGCAASSRDMLRALKRAGIRRPRAGARCWAPTRTPCARGALEHGLDAGRTSASTPAPRSSSRSRRTCTARTRRSARPNPTPRQKVVILGSGPNRIGQGIEFDYCCCHAAFALREEGFETVMINCNPETVSTDYDTVDRLYFEPLTFEDVYVDHRPRAGGRRRRRRASSSTAARRR